MKILNVYFWKFNSETDIATSQSWLLQVEISQFTVSQVILKFTDNFLGKKYLKEKKWKLR